MFMFQWHMFKFKRKSLFEFLFALLYLSQVPLPIMKGEIEPLI